MLDRVLDLFVGFKK